LSWARAAAAFAVVLASGCGSQPTVAPDAGGPPRPIELPLLTSNAAPFTHGAEPSIAARNGHVAIASINLQFASTDAFDDSDTYGRRVAVVVSDDGGETWGDAIDPMLGPYSSDPVIRTDGTGRFWLAMLDATSPLDRALPGFLAVSDNGHIWKRVVDTGASGSWWGDRDMLVVSGNDELQIAAEGGFWRYSSDGTLLDDNMSTPYDGGFAAGFHDARGSHFAGAGGSYVLQWDGATAPTQELQLPVSEDPDFHGGKSLGATSDGHYWLLRATATSGVVLDLWQPGSSQANEIALGNAATFLPAGELDGEGRLHAIWYDSSGPSGQLLYARSNSSDLSAGFGSPMVVDPNACPGNGWKPGSGPGERRRLREYIGLAVDGNRVHMAWTHAPSPPARVYTVYTDF
jgi:hypothetical protein